jgi:predicted transcriptional regulator
MMTLTIDDELERQLEALGATTESVKTRFAREAVAEAVQRIEERSVEEARFAQVREEIDRAFSGPSREWTGEDWEKLMSGRYRHEFEPGSLAVPPGWLPKSDPK